MLSESQIPTGGYPNSECVDHLVLARNIGRKSPQDIFLSLWRRGDVRIVPCPDLFFEGGNNYSVINESSVEGMFTDWAAKDIQRFTDAQAAMRTEDDNVLTYLGELVNPDDDEDTRPVMFIAAGGVREGFITARGVCQMRRAVVEAERRRIPIIFFNAVTSADPLFSSEVGQISRQISRAMETGLSLTVPKLTVITGEAVSAGAHAAWQAADHTFIFETGAFLNVIKPEEAINLLHFGPDIVAKANARFIKEYLGTTLQSTVIPLLVQGADVAEKVLEDTPLQALRRLEVEDNIQAVVAAVKEDQPQSHEKIMMILPAERSRFVTGMLTRGADMITLQTDDWQKSVQPGKEQEAKTKFLAQLRKDMATAQKTKVQDQTNIYLRLDTADFAQSGFWQIEDIKNILRELKDVGLTGIRLTQTVTVHELEAISQAMYEAETESDFPAGYFRICLSVENDEAINSLAETIENGDKDKLVSAVVMGVRDYTISQASNGVKEREWSHPKVIEAKTRLMNKATRLRNGGWNELYILHAVASEYSDWDMVHLETNQSQTLGADGMLVVSPEQIPHVRAAFKGLYDPDGKINEGRFQEALRSIKQKINLIAGYKPDDSYADVLISNYHRLLYAIYHDYRVRLLQAGNAFPAGLKEVGIADKVISGESDELIRQIWQYIVEQQIKSPAEIREARTQKLARLGQATVKSIEPIPSAVRAEKARGRSQHAAQFWLDLITRGAGYDAEILTDIEPVVSFDVLARLGRTGLRSYAGQINEAQERTGTLTGIIAGYTRIEDRNILLIVRDQDYIGATAGASTGEFVRRACLDAVERKRAGQQMDSIVYIDVSAGGRVQEGAFATLPSELAVAGLVKARENIIKVINIGHTYILGSDGIGPFYCADKIALVGKTTELGLAGRRIVERTSPLGKQEYPPGFRLAPYHLAVGNIDALLETPEDLLPYLKETLLSL